jgi:hypothetical protein
VDADAVIRTTPASLACLIFSGMSLKYPDINWIFSHGGGALTAFAERFLIQMVTTPPYKDKFTRAQVEGELKRFFYDTAQISNTVTIGATAFFKGDDLKAVDRENALRILPRLRGA